MTLLPYSHLNFCPYIYCCWLDIGVNIPGFKRRFKCDVMEYFNIKDTLRRYSKLTFILRFRTLKNFEMIFDNPILDFADVLEKEKLSAAQSKIN